MRRVSGTPSIALRGDRSSYGCCSNESKEGHGGMGESLFWRDKGEWRLLSLLNSGQAVVPLRFGTGLGGNEGIKGGGTRMEDRR